MTDQPTTRTTRTAAGVRGRALLVALGLALAAAVLPATAAHASPQAPDTSNQLTNPGGNPQPPEPPDPPQWGPEDVATRPRTPTPTRTPTRRSTTPSRPRSASTPGSAAPPPVPTRSPAWP